MGTSRTGSRLPARASRWLLAGALLAAAQCFAQSHPKQETRGAQSPNVYAPGGKVTIQYGISAGDLGRIQQGISEAVQREIAKLATPQEAGLDLQEELKRRLEADRVRFGNASRHYKTGYERVQARDYGSGSLAFKAALAEVPDFFQALMGLGRCYLELGQADAARKAYDAALKVARERKNPRWEAEVLVRTGAALRKAGQELEAARLIDEGMKIADAAGYRNLVILVRLGKRPATGTMREKLFWLVDMIYAVKLSEKRGPIALANLAEISLGALGEFLDHGEHGLSDLNFERYRSTLDVYYRDTTPILDSPSEVDLVSRAFLFVGRSALELGDPSPRKTKVSIDRALDVLDQEALTALRAGVPPPKPPPPAVPSSPVESDERDARIQARIEDVIGQYTRLLASQPARPDAYYQRGRFNLKAGRYAAGLVDLDRALDLDPRHAAALYHRAIVKVLLDDLAGAREDYLKAVDARSPWLAGLEEASAAAEAALGPDAKKENMVAAQEKLGEFLAAKPDSADALLKLASLKRAGGEHAKALELLARARTFRPDFSMLEGERAKVHGERARARLAAGDPAGAAEDFNAVVRHDAKAAQLKDKNGFRFWYSYSPAADLPVYGAKQRAALSGAEKDYYLGFLSLLLGSRAKALAQFDSVLKQEDGNPRWVDAAMNRAGILLSEGKADAARHGLDTVLARRGAEAAYAEAYLFRAYEHRRVGRNDLALRDLDRFLELRPASENAASAYFERGQIRHSQNVEAALADYRRVLDLKASDELGKPARLNIAYLLEYQGKDEEALKQYDALLDQSYRTLHILQLSAKLHLKLGHVDLALQRYGTIIDGKWDPVEPAAVALARFNRGRILYHRGDREGAGVDFAEVIRLAPKTEMAAVSHLNIGRLEDEAKKPDAAIRSFRAALELYPNYVEALNALAWLYATNTRDLDEALTLARKAVKLNPRAEYWDTLAEAHFARGEYAEAREANEAARARAEGSKDLLQIIDERASRIDARQKR